MATEQDTPTAVINVAGVNVPESVELTVEPASLFDDQERRALAVERSAWAITARAPGRFPDVGELITLAEYVVRGSDPRRGSAG